jgi:DNA-binding MarR family transcriptional regulator
VAQRLELELDEYFPYLINRVGVALVMAFETGALRRHHLSIAMWRVLAALSRNGGQRLVDLSAMTSIDVSTLSRMVTRLLRLELVTRMRSEKSDREIVVKLTVKGRKVLTRLIPIALQFERGTIAGLSQSDLAVVKRALRQMHENTAALPSLLVQPPSRRRASG